MENIEDSFIKPKPKIKKENKVDEEGIFTKEKKETMIKEAKWREFLEEQHKMGPKKRI